MVSNVTHQKNLKRQTSKRIDTPKYRRWPSLVTPVIGFFALLFSQANKVFKLSF